MAFLIQRDALIPMLEQFEGTYQTGVRDGHSRSVGPRYQKYGPGALKGGAQTI